MRRLAGLLLAVAVFAAAACDSGTAEKPTGSGDTGIGGVALAGPVCPVERPGDPACAPRPVAGATIVIRDAAGNEVASATTDRKGRFEALVPPGRYTVQGLPVEGLMANPAPIDVDVAIGIAAVDLPYDTGIR